MEAIKTQPAPEPQVNNEEIVAQIKAQYEEQLNTERQQRMNLVKQNALNEFKSALASESIVAEGLEPLTLMAQSRLQIDDFGNPRIMSADGSKPLQDRGQMVTPQLATWRKNLQRQARENYLFAIVACQVEENHQRAKAGTQGKITP